jgi:uncharacterized membrane protein YraQ (UPF0718 family)
MGQKKKRRSGNMLEPTIVMGLIALILFAIAYSRGGGEHIEGVKSGAILTLQILPLLFFAFMIAGLIQALIPRELLSQWVGTESGWRGIFLGSLAGGLTPGGPYVSFPIAAALLKAGASVGTLVAFVTAWSLWALGRLPIEVGIIGWRFTLVRFLSTLIFPPIAGFIAEKLFSRFPL